MTSMQYFYDRFHETKHISAVHISAVHIKQIPDSRLPEVVNVAPTSDQDNNYIQRTRKCLSKVKCKWDDVIFVQTNDDRAAPAGG